MSQLIMDEILKSVYSVAVLFLRNQTFFLEFLFGLSLDYFERDFSL